MATKRAMFDIVDGSTRQVCFQIHNYNLIKLVWYDISLVTHSTNDSWDDSC